MLLWDNENYYLVAYAAEDDKIKHYRVDKMLKISVTGEKREGRELFKALDPATYSSGLFGMFGGEEVRVTLEARNDMIGILIDRFGKDLLVTRTDEDHFRTVVAEPHLIGVLIDRFGKDIRLTPIDGGRIRAKVKVAVSPQFMGWVMALGDGMRIVGPESVVARMRAEVRRLAERYDSNDEA